MAIKEKLLPAGKAALKAAIIAFVGALGFGGFAPDTLSQVLSLLGLK